MRTICARLCQIRGFPRLNIPVEWVELWACCRSALHDALIAVTKRRAAAQAPLGVSHQSHEQSQGCRGLGKQDSGRP